MGSLIVDFVHFSRALAKFFVLVERPGTRKYLGSI